MADTAKPKKKPFLTVGIPGARHTLGGGTSGGGSPIAQPNLLGALQTKSPVSASKGVKSPATLNIGEAGQVGSNSPTGRPKSNLGQYLVKPTDTTNTGYEMLNDNPDLLDQVHTKFIEKFELPTHLRPTRFLSPELEHARGLNISRGWRKPRSRAG
jgi:hypothetical protein